MIQYLYLETHILFSFVDFDKHMLVVGLELFLIQSDYCCCVFFVVMPVVCSNQRPALLAATAWMFRCHRKVKYMVQRFPLQPKRTWTVCLYRQQSLWMTIKGTHMTTSQSHTWCSWKSD